MNRPLKFRAWDMGTMYRMPLDSVYGIARFFGFLSDEAIIMQYTGLKDKDGTEIYEGDILSVCNGSINGSPIIDKPYAVDYALNKGFRMCMFCWDKEGNSVMDNTHYCEVIGNIHEHASLLKQE